MTSNLGSDLIREKFEGLTAENRDVVVEDAKETVLAMLKQTIRPEFLNRIDEIIMFTPLSKAETRRIVDLQIDSIYKMLKNSGVELRVTEDARDFIAEEGYDPQFGARPIKRVIQRYLLNDLSKSLLAQTVDKEKPIVVDKKDGSLVFSN
jgi:ATP-dependent Clp protease ATP-binding subunit ClpB